MTAQQINNIVRECTTKNDGFNSILSELNTAVVCENSNNDHLINLGYLIKEYKITPSILLNAFESLNNTSKTNLLDLKGYARFICNISTIFTRASKENEIPVVIYG